MRRMIKNINDSNHDDADMIIIMIIDNHNTRENRALFCNIYSLDIFY